MHHLSAMSFTTTLLVAGASWRQHLPVSRTVSRCEFFADAEGVVRGVASVFFFPHRNALFFDLVPSTHVMPIIEAVLHCDSTWLCVGLLLFANENS